MELVENPTGLPEVLITREELEKGLPLVDVLVFVGFAKSKREARQFIKDGAVRLSHVSPK